MRLNGRIWITTFGIYAATALAAPAAAAEAMSLALRTPSPFNAGHEKKRERSKAERPTRRERGPFHPAAGTPDYGTEVNRFGNDRGTHIHAGQDVFAPAGTPLLAASDGVIVEAGTDGGRGNYAYLYDPKRGETYVYFHMLGPAEAGVGEAVHAGQRIGAIGCTGSCWGDHVHFEIHAGRGSAGEARDPLPDLLSWDPVDS